MKPIDQKANPLDPSTFVECYGRLEEESRRRNLAKKTSKLSSTPPNPNQFLKEYKEVVDRNKETTWLMSNEVKYKQKVQKIESKPKAASSTPIPPFFMNNSQAQKSVKSSSEPSGNSSVKPQIRSGPANNEILQVVESLDPIQAHQRELKNLKPEQRIGKAFEKMAKVEEKNKASPPKKIIITPKYTSKEQQEIIDLSNQPPSPTFRQEDPFAEMNKPRRITNTGETAANVAQTQQSQITSNNTNQQQTQNQQGLPNPSLTIQTNNSFKINQNQNNSGSPQNSTLPKGNLIGNTINANSSATLNQVTNILNTPIDNRAAIFNNNRATLQTNNYNNFSNTLPNNQGSSNRGGFNSFNNNSFSQPNNMNIQQTNMMNFQQKTPAITQQGPNTHSYTNANQSSIPTTTTQPQSKSNWISYLKNNPRWVQFRAQLAQKIKNRPEINDQKLDILAAMAFESRSALTLSQIEKNAEEIIILGNHFQNKRQPKPKKSHEPFQSISRDFDKHIAFDLKSYLHQLSIIRPKDFSKYTEAQIQKLKQNKAVMNRYEKYKNYTPEEFIEEYTLFQYRSALEIEQIAAETMKLFQKQKELQKLAQQYEKESKKHHYEQDSKVFDEIQDRQEDIFNLCDKVKTKLKIKEEDLLPKNQLCYEIQDLKKIEAEEKNLLQQIKVWRDLLQGSRNAEPYKEVIDTLCEAATDLLQKVKEIEDLLPVPESHQPNDY